MKMLRGLKRRINSRVARSLVGRYFRLEQSSHPNPIYNSHFLTEVAAGITTFFTLSYVIAVNANVLASSGGPCVCSDPADPLCISNRDYLDCKSEVQKDFIMATAVVSCIASFVFGLLTNLPVALASGMGLNAFFAFEVVGYHGSGPLPYRTALTAVFIEGFVFLALSLTGMRQWMVRVIPSSIKIASGCGIGLFLALIGLSRPSGIGAVSSGFITPLTLAGCPDEYVDPVTHLCLSHRMQSPKMWFGIVLGGVLTAYLMSYRVRAAIIIGILAVAATAWPRDTSFTMFPRTELGDAQFEYFRQIVAVRPMRRILGVLDWDIAASTGADGPSFAVVILTMLYVDIIDCTGTLYSMARFSGVINPDTGDFPRSTLAYSIDAASISLSALFGISPSTAMVESGAGIAEGGKTGLTAITTSLCFFVAIFFGPIFGSIPPWATGCTLVLVGCMMARQITMINWRYIGDAVPAFVTVLLMPFTYTIAYGLIAGIGTYAALNLLLYLTGLASCGRLVPADEDHREYWTIKPAGSAPWFVRAFRDPRGFLRSPAAPEDRSGYDPAAPPLSEMRTFRNVLEEKEVLGVHAEHPDHDHPDHDHHRLSSSHRKLSPRCNHSPDCDCGLGEAAAESPSASTSSGNPIVGAFRFGRRQGGQQQQQRQQRQQRQWWPRPHQHRLPADPNSDPFERAIARAEWEAELAAHDLASPTSPAPSSPERPPSSGPAAEAGGYRQHGGMGVGVDLGAAAQGGFGHRQQDRGQSGRTRSATAVSAGSAVSWRGPDEGESGLNEMAAQFPTAPVRAYRRPPGQRPER